ncbi:MAG TPA: hypothetical protein VMA30_09435 [Xanthobacteraceae bacterium]|nr:hypothetical protein [Xanthobacteraceae bacterium]
MDSGSRPPERAAVRATRRVAIDAAKTFLDTNNTAHHHVLVDDNPVDVVTDEPVVSGMPPLPSGHEIDHVDIIVRLRRKSQ